MKKIYLLLTLFLCSMGITWATNVVPEEGKAYLLKATGTEGEFYINMDDQDLNSNAQFVTAEDQATPVLFVASGSKWKIMSRRNPTWGLGAKTWNATVTTSPAKYEIKDVEGDATSFRLYQEFSSSPGFVKKDAGETKVYCDASEANPAVVTFQLVEWEAPANYTVVITGLPDSLAAQGALTYGSESWSDAAELPKADHEDETQWGAATVADYTSRVKVEGDNVHVYYTYDWYTVMVNNSSESTLGENFGLLLGGTVYPAGSRVQKSTIPAGTVPEANPVEGYITRIYAMGDYVMVGYTQDFPAPGIDMTKYVSISATKAETMQPSDLSGESHWYILSQTRNGESPVYATANNSQAKRATFTTPSLNLTPVSDTKDYLVRFIPVVKDSVAEGAPQTYNIQFGNGLMLSNGLRSVNAFTAPGEYLFYNVKKDGEPQPTSFGWNLFGSDDDPYGSLVDNNGKDMAISFWESGEKTNVGGNNDWDLYEVAFEDAPANITYQVTENDSVVWQTVMTAKKGTAYPQPANPSAFVNLSAVPEGTVSGDETVQLSYTSNYACAATPEEVTQWYALDIHGNEAQYPVYSDGEEVRVKYEAYTNYENDYTHGAVDNDNLAWAFVGTPFGGVKLYNKGSQKYAEQENDADEIIKMSDNGTVFMISGTDGQVENSFAVKAAGRRYYFNHRKTYVQGWTSNDAGSSLRAYEINTVDSGVNVELQGKYGTLASNFYAPVPEGLKAYTVTVDADNQLVLEEQTEVKAGKAYLLKIDEPVVTPDTTVVDTTVVDTTVVTPPAANIMPRLTVEGDTTFYFLKSAGTAQYPCYYGERMPMSLYGKGYFTQLFFFTGEELPDGSLKAKIRVYNRTYADYGDECLVQPDGDWSMTKEVFSKENGVDWYFKMNSANNGVIISSTETQDDGTCLSVGKFQAQSGNAADSASWWTFEAYDGVTQYMADGASANAATTHTFAAKTVANYTAPVTTGALTGVYADTDVAAGNYVFTQTPRFTAFMPVSDTTSVAAGTCYIAGDTTKVVEGYILEDNRPWTITYQVKEGDEVIWSEAVEVEKTAEAYPQPTFENPFITLNGVPEGAPTGNETVELGYTSLYTCAAEADSITQWYAFDIHANEALYPLYFNSEDAGNVHVKYNAYVDYEKDYQHGTVESDDFAWGFVGNPFTGVKLYNKGAQKYAVQANDADEKVTFGDEGTVFQFCETNSGIENSFAMKVEGRRYYFNHRGEYVQGWTDADHGSSLRAFPIDFADETMDITLNGTNGTIIVPFYAALPEGLKAYKATTVDENGQPTLVEVTSLEPATAYIIEGTAGETYTLSYSSKGVYTDPVTTGVLTGVWADSVLAPADADATTALYVLVPGQGLTFAEVTEENPATVKAGECFLVATKGLTVGIKGVKSAIKAENGAIYTIDGVRVQKAERGIYIINGKKVIKK